MPASSKKEKKCNYRWLTKGEIKKLKKNGYDPEELKDPFDSQTDVFKCKKSGKIAVGRKHHYQGDDGLPVYPGGEHYEDLCINIDALPWTEQDRKKVMMDETRVEFRVGGFDKPIAQVLRSLPDQPEIVHNKGENRGKSTKLTYSCDWFAYKADLHHKSFDEAVSALLSRLHLNRQTLQKACGDHKAKLSCVFYFHPDHRPSICFKSEMLRHINDLGAEIDVDLYPMG